MKYKKVLLWFLIICLTLGMAGAIIYATLNVSLLNNEINQNLKKLPINNKSHFNLEQKRSQNELLPLTVSYIQYFNNKTPFFDETLIQKHLPVYYEDLIYKKMNLNHARKTIDLKFTYKIIKSTDLVINLHWKVYDVNQEVNTFLKVYYDYFILRLNYKTKG